MVGDEGKVSATNSRVALPETNHDTVSLLLLQTDMRMSAVGNYETGFVVNFNRQCLMRKMKQGALQQ